MSLPVLAFLLGSTLLALALAAYLSLLLDRTPRAERAFTLIADKIATYADTYVHRQYAVIGGFTIVAFTLLAVLMPVNGWDLAVGFLTGTLLSGIAGYVGLHVARIASTRAIRGAGNGMVTALLPMMTAGGVTGLVTLALATSGVAGLFAAYRLSGLDLTLTIDMLAGFAYGATIAGFLKRVSGGIFAKVADIGEYILAGSTRDMRENDPKNPATLADNVGDNAGDVVGAVAGFFAIYAVALVAAMTIASTNLGDELLAFTDSHVYFPLVIGGVTLLATIAGMFVIRGGHALSSLRIGLAVTAGFAAGGIYIANQFLTQNTNILLAAFVGLAMGKLTILATEYFTAGSHTPVQMIAMESSHGAGFTVLAGLSNGFRSTLAVMSILIVGIATAYELADFYGIAIAAVSMLSLGGYFIAMSVFGVVADNAVGIAEMGGADKKILTTLHPLDEAGNVTAAVVKSFAIVAAGLVAVVLIRIFRDTLFAHGAPEDLLVFSLADIRVIAGVLLGALLPFVFAGSLLRIVLRGVDVVLTAVDGKRDLARALTIFSQRASILPSALVIVAPIVVGYLLGIPALAGFLIGSTSAALLLAITAATAGSSWDNAKKYVELHRAGNAARSAAVAGDTVGDPLKDTIAPSLTLALLIVLLTALIIATVAAGWRGIV